MTKNIDKQKLELLEATLDQVAFDGWSDKSLEAAAESLGKERNDAYTYFPGGIEEVIRYFGQVIDDRMEKELEKIDLESMRIRDRIHKIVMIRLHLYAPYREAVRQLTARYALPFHAPKALGNIWKTVDAMWYAAGDTATDYNYYTKRGLLAGVYTSTFLRWLRDESNEYTDTSAFLTRRIEDVMKIQGLRSKLDDMGEQLKRMCMYSNVR